MSHAAAFSPDYTAARARFRSSSLALGAGLEEHPIGQRGPEGEELTIDVARLGADDARRVLVISSGLHGVEGFLGSAVQAALLEEELGGWRPPRGAALVLIHALNPYGYAWIRRVNEDNVDLNRNFLLPDQAYRGAPERYPELDPFFNPPRRPSTLEPFKLKAAALIARNGLAALKETLPVGQYEYPKGLFFGGAGPSRTLQILDGHLGRWIGAAEQVLHLDFHSGLGPWATYKLFLNRELDDPRSQWLSDVFGDDVVEAWDPGATSYAIRGGMGTWCRHRFPDTAYDQLTAEFGTYHILRVVEALRRENMAHFWAREGDTAIPRAKANLKETFAPSEIDWRERVVEQGLDVVQKGLEACFG